MSAYKKLTRSNLRNLKPGQAINERGIVYEKYERDGRWSVNVMLAGRRIHRAVGFESQGFTRTQAEELVAKLKAAKHEHSHGMVAPRNRRVFTIATAVPDYLDFLRTHDGRDVEAKSRRFEQHVVRLLGKVKLHAITADDWSSYATMRKAERASPATINRERSALLHLLNTAKRRKLIRDVPLLDRLAEPPGKLIYLSPAQAQRLVDAAAIDQSRHALPFVMIALYTGMRHASVLNLRGRDVDADRRVLWIGADKAGAREQPMPTILADYLREFIRDMDPNDLLFASKRAESGRLYQANAIFARCVARAELGSGITPHTLRHTAATNAAQAGLDTATIAALGGWKTRQMAERYTHAANLSEAMDRVGARISGRTVTPKLHQRSKKVR
jgi:integrase